MWLGLGLINLHVILRYRPPLRLLVATHADAVEMRSRQLVVYLLSMYNFAAAKHGSAGFCRRLGTKVHYIKIYINRKNNFSAAQILIIETQLYAIF
jgi:hypothetical protein